MTVADALLLIDLQHDFVSPDGAYGRAGVECADIAALPARLAPVVDAARSAGLPIVSAQFTLAECGERLMISEPLQRLRPFLRRGDFRPGTRGHALVDKLAPADVVVEKVAHSAFYMSRLEWVLRHLGARSLLVAGIITNGGVAATVRDAHLRDLHCTLLADGCASFDADVHRAALRALSAGVVDLVDCEQAAARLHSETR